MESDELATAYTDREAEAAAGAGKEGNGDLFNPGDRPVGIVTLMRGHYTVPDIGFALLPSYTRKGFATEAGRYVIEEYATVPVAEGGLGLAGVFGFTSANNENSKKVCERLRLVYRGVWPLEAFGGEDSAVFAMEGMGEVSEYGIKGERVDK